MVIQSLLQNKKDFREPLGSDDNSAREEKAERKKAGAGRSRCCRLGQGVKNNPRVLHMYLLILIYLYTCVVFLLWQTTLICYCSNIDFNQTSTRQRRAGICWVGIQELGYPSA